MMKLRQNTFGRYAMRNYLWTFVGLMLVVGSGCSKPIEFDVKITNNCPGNDDLQKDVKYILTYFKSDPDNPLLLAVTDVIGRVDRDKSVNVEIADGADINRDGFLDSGDLNSTPPATDVLWITLDYLDADDSYNDSWIASTGTIVDGSTVEVTINSSCLASYEIKYPASAAVRGSSLQSGVFSRVDKALPQDINGD
jgi:hypothetical protein